MCARLRSVGRMHSRVAAGQFYTTNRGEGRRGKEPQIRELGDRGVCKFLGVQ